MPDSTRAGKIPLILIVDDERYMRVVFRDLLEGAGFATVMAADGASALTCFRKRQPELVLLDLAMPGMDGLTVCREIRALPEGKYTPMLMMTALDDTESIHHAFEAGATDFISKPINFDLLVYRVRYMIRSSQSMKILAESREMLASAQSIAHLGNWEWDPLANTIRGSEETFRILGMEKQVLVISFDRFLFAVYPPDRERVESGLKNASKSKSSCRLEFRVKRSDGTLRAVRLQGNVVASTSQKIPRITGTLQDVTEPKQIEDRLKLLKEAVDCLPVGITISDVRGKIIYSNPAEAEMHGYTVEELAEKDARIFAPRSLSKPFSPDEFKRVGVWRRESVNVRKNGEEFPVQLSSIAVTDVEGKCLGIVTACEDITSRKEAEQRIKSLAYYDTLTGLLNRAAFVDRLHQALALAHREGHSIALIFLDLDNFKYVNDTQGHDFGDKLLMAVAKRISAGMRESDTLARLGGDEFVLVLTAISGQESAAIAAQRILELFKQPFSVDGRQIYSSVSIGIALYPGDGQDAESLFKCADTAMYHAKKDGRSRYWFFSEEMNQKIMHRVALENSMRRGVGNGEFHLHFQPQWDLKMARIVGVEALLRWQSPDFGLLLPSAFIPLAENSGLIFDLGEWVIRSACIQARNWSLAGHNGLKMAVNISGKQLRQPDFLEITERIIRETGVDPGNLEFEFTESVIMEKADRTINTLAALKELGIKLSIDDFGTGYSSLSYLKHFPIDRIKIDRSFVMDIDSDKDDATIIEAIISMAHSLKLKVVAEGVETGKQLQFLVARGCDEVQGYYLAKPMAASEIAQRLFGPDGKSYVPDASLLAACLGGMHALTHHD
jgi:diguanylate cyclase (GGDEF)-like protein/PAS domain S-box-containing protein